MANSKFSGDVKRTYAVGEVIVREGDVDGEMYIIQKGRVRLYKKAGLKKARKRPQFSKR